jgi:aspartyl-tRNA(Asn)/glutamyl-tRNA(Gln) amidotransferase subunit A
MSAAPSNILNLSVSELGRKIRAGETSPTALAEGYLDRIGRLDSRLNAFVTITRDLAMEQARQAERELASGKDRGPLHGIPFGAKDLVSTAGIRTTWGAPVYKERVFNEDAFIIKKMQEAGAVLLGKCAMIEMAGGLGYEYASASLTGATRNPWNTEHWTCGSSAGSGAAVAGRLLPAAVGSETWGSITCPSSFCGISGLRPTYGRISRRGAMALSWTMDKLGPMAQTAEDCELLLEAMSGHDAGDPSSIEEELGARLSLAEASRLKIGVFKLPKPDGADLALWERFDAALDSLRKAGLQLTEIELPEMPIESAAWVVILSEGAAAMESLFDSGRIREMAGPNAPLAYPKSKMVRASDYLKAMRIRTLAQRAYAKLFSEVDAVVSLGMAFTASPVEGNLNDYFEGSDPMGGAGNLCGLPGLAVPIGFGSNDLPGSMMIMSGAYEERKALGIGKLFQSVTDWHTRIPPLVS